MRGASVAVDLVRVLRPSAFPDGRGVSRDRVLFLLLDAALWTFRVRRSLPPRTGFSDGEPVFSCFGVSVSVFWFALVLIIISPGVSPLSCHAPPKAPWSRVMELGLYVDRRSSDVLLQCSQPSLTPWTGAGCGGRACRETSLTAGCSTHPGQGPAVASSRTTLLGGC